MSRERKPSHPKHPLYVPGIVQPYQVAPAIPITWTQIVGAPPIGPPLMHLDTPDESWPFPGPTGPQGPIGPTGAPGAGGSGSTTIFLPHDDYVDESFVIPGPQGASGPTGAPGAPGGGSSSIIMLPVADDPGNDDALAATGSGVVGAGTPNMFTKWINGGRMLLDTPLQDASTAAGKILKLIATGAGVVAQLYLDAAAGNVRDLIFSSAGVVRWIFRGDNTAEAGSNSGTDFVINRRDDAGGDLGNALTITRSSGVITAQTYVFQSAVNKTLAADQAAFANVQTNITGLSFPIGINEVWEVIVDLSVTMVLATGVKFYATGPASVTGEIHAFGSTTAATAYQHLYQAAITVPGTFLNTVAGSGYYRLRLTVRTGATPGTIQIVGITGGATTTCAVLKGSSMKATRTT